MRRSRLFDDNTESNGWLVASKLVRAVVHTAIAGLLKKYVAYDDAETEILKMWKWYSVGLRSSEIPIQKPVEQTNY